MVIKVLVAPAGPTLNNEKYGKEYYLLQHMARVRDDMKFDTYFRDVRNQPSEDNISATAVGSTRNQFYYKAFNITRKQISNGVVDLYHHMNFHYRFYNPLMIAKVTRHVPTVVGPAEPPHDVPDPSKRAFVRRTLNVDLSDDFLDKLLPLLNVSQRYIYNPVREILFALTLRQADRIVVVNEETATLYSKYVPRSKIEVIPYGVVPARFKKGDPRRSDDMIAVGSLYHRKGVHVLIRAWSKIAPQYPESRLHVIGDGPQKPQLEQLADDLAVGDSVVFHGFIERESLIDHFANARAFVHPSLSEGFPHVRLEAMASACPVIASDVTGAREMVRDGTDGIVVPVDSVTALADAISKLLSDPELAYSMGRNGYENVQANYDWYDIAERFLEIYENLL